MFFGVNHCAQNYNIISVVELYYNLIVDCVVYFWFGPVPVSVSYIIIYHNQLYYNCAAINSPAPPSRVRERRAELRRGSVGDRKGDGGRRQVE